MHARLMGVSMIALLAAMPAMAQTKVPASPPPAATQAAPAQGATAAGATTQAAPFPAPQAQAPQAQTAPAAIQPAPTVLSIADRHFVDTAATDGKAEVEMGRLAAAKATSPEVRDFANRMVSDHSRANDQLVGIARLLNATPPNSIAPKHQQALDRLNAAAAPQFDMQYMNHQVRDHVAAVALFRKEANEGQNPTLKQFAASTLPTLEDHLKHARTVHAALRAQRPTASIGTTEGRPRTSRRAPASGGEQFSADQLNDAEHRRYVQGMPAIAAKPCGIPPQQAMRSQVQPGAQPDSTKPPEANLAMQRMNGNC